MRIERHLQVIDREVASRYLPNTLLIFLILSESEVMPGVKTWMP